MGRVLLGVLLFIGYALSGAVLLVGLASPPGERMPLIAGAVVLVLFVRVVDRG